MELKYNDDIYHNEIMKYLRFKEHYEVEKKVF